MRKKLQLKRKPILCTGIKEYQVQRKAKPLQSQKNIGFHAKQLEVKADFTSRRRIPFKENYHLSLGKTSIILMKTGLHSNIKWLPSKTKLDFSQRKINLYSKKLPSFKGKRSISKRKSSFSRKKNQFCPIMHSKNVAFSLTISSFHQKKNHNLCKIQQ